MGDRVALPAVFVAAGLPCGAASIHYLSQAGSCSRPRHRAVSQPGPAFWVWGDVVVRAGGGVLCGITALALKHMA